METFGDHVPNFNVGYYDGRQSKRDGFVVRMTLMICTQTEMVERSHFGVMVERVLPQVSKLGHVSVNKK